MVETSPPAFCARRGTVVSDWWTLLHSPYTAWHLSYVVLGAAIAASRDWVALGFCVVAFFLAVGLAAHALDELYDRPLKTGIGSATLRAVAVLALVGAAGLGILGAFYWDGQNWALAAAMPLGVLPVVGYNLELFDGALHTDHAFSWAWGGFPVIVGYLAQSPPLSPTGLIAAIAATLTAVGASYAQRFLSTPARRLRRHTASVSGTLTTENGAQFRWTTRFCLPLLKERCAPCRGQSRWLPSRCCSRGRDASLAAAE